MATLELLLLPTQELLLPTQAPEGEHARAEARLAHVRCDLLVSIDLDRDGRVGASDVAAWFGEIDEVALTEAELTTAVALAKARALVANESSTADDDMDDLGPSARARNSVFGAVGTPGLPKRWRPR